MPLSDSEEKKLKAKAKEIREKIIKVTEACGGSHVGGALSQTDILVALYYKYMTFDPKDPEKADRDRFILSKGHGGVGHAVILGDLGFFDEKELLKFNKTGSPFGMHLDRLKVKGVDASTGSLGHGFAIAVGMAMGARLQNQSWRTYCVLGDGECNEGTVWETALSAKQYGVANMTLIVDRNQLCIDGCTEDVMGLEPFKEKWESFGFKTIVIDGHDFKQIAKAIDESLAEKEKPVVIVAETVKGKGVDYMEGDYKWHYAGLDSEMAEKAIESIRKSG